LSATEVQAVQLFTDTADPEGYVARPETEDVLVRLQARVVEARASGVVVGPPGMGKSLLLRVLQRRFEPSLESHYLPNSALSCEDLCAWTVGSLGGGLPAFPRSALMEIVQRRSDAGSAVVLLIDDADALPQHAARELGELVDAGAGGLRLVLAAPDHGRTSRVLAALGTELENCRLCLPLELAESRRCIENELRRKAAPMAIRLRFDAGTIARIHRLSTGIPRRIDILADRIVAAARPAGKGRRESDLPLLELGADMALGPDDEEGAVEVGALRSSA